MIESEYQLKLIKKLRKMFPGCVILKNDPRYVQGMPDILILFKDTWAMLEVKLYPDARVQPNQEHYVGFLNDMSFASFINPDTEGEVLNALQQSFRSIGETRVSQS